jgi:hypothetical protein
LVLKGSNLLFKRKKRIFLQFVQFLSFSPDATGLGATNFPLLPLLSLLPSFLLLLLLLLLTGSEFCHIHDRTKIFGLGLIVKELEEGQKLSITLEHSVSQYSERNK